MFWLFGRPQPPWSLDAGIREDAIPSTARVTVKSCQREARVKPYWCVERQTGDDPRPEGSFCVRPVLNKLDESVRGEYSTHTSALRYDRHGTAVNNAGRTCDRKGLFWPSPHHLHFHLRPPCRQRASSAIPRTLEQQQPATESIDGDHFSLDYPRRIALGMRYQFAFRLKSPPEDHQPR